MTDEDAVGILIELFGWDDDPLCRWHALKIYKSARGEACPSWDEWRCEVGL